MSEPQSEASNLEASLILLYPLYGKGSAFGMASSLNGTYTKNGVSPSPFSRDEASQARPLPLRDVQEGNPPARGFIPANHEKGIRHFSHIQDSGYLPV